MSASTVSITANQASTARRRPVEKSQPSDAPPVDAKTSAGDTIRNRKSSGGGVPHRKTPKPRWLTVVSILTKNAALLVVLIGLVQMIRWVVMHSGKDSDGLSVISGDLDGKVAEMERFVKSTLKAMQVQVTALDGKFDDGIRSVREEFAERMEKKGEELDLKIKALDARTDGFEKFIDGFRGKSVLSKEEFDGFFEEFRKARKSKGGVGGGEVSLDEIREYAREVVEKEIERHAADGLGMVDYALAAGGGKVVKHSVPYGVGSVGLLSSRNRVAAEAVKMLNPSFGEPGSCFPLKGSSGFVDVRLRTAVVPEAVTLEHVAKSVAYDRSSAPKDCRVSGWFQGDLVNVEDDAKKMFLLTEFTYDLEKSNAQTFRVLESAASRLVDTVRFEFASNHGSASHTCIYRLRVHGQEASSFQS